MYGHWLPHFSVITVAKTPCAHSGASLLVSSSAVLVSRLVGVFPGNHGWGNRVNTSAAAQWAGIFIDLPNLDQSGSLAGVAFVPTGIESLAIAESAAVRPVQRDAGVVPPAA